MWRKCEWGLYKLLSLVCHCGCLTQRALEVSVQWQASHFLVYVYDLMSTVWACATISSKTWGSDTICTCLKMICTIAMYRLFHFIHQRMACSQSTLNLCSTICAFVKQELQICEGKLYPLEAGKRSIHYSRRPIVQQSHLTKESCGALECLLSC